MDAQQRAELVRTVKESLGGTSEWDRANLAYDLMRALYDHAKFWGVGGEGLDGRDGAERRALGSVVDLLAEHQIAAMKRANP